MCSPIVLQTWGQITSNTTDYGKVPKVCGHHHCQSNGNVTGPTNNMLGPSISRHLKMIEPEYDFFHMLHTPFLTGHIQYSTMYNSIRNVSYHSLNVHVYIGKESNAFPKAHELETCTYISCPLNLLQLLISTCDHELLVLHLHLDAQNHSFSQRPRTAPYRPWHQIAKPRRTLRYCARQCSRSSSTASARP